MSTTTVSRHMQRRLRSRPVSFNASLLGDSQGSIDPGTYPALGNLPIAIHHQIPCTSLCKTTTTTTTTMPPYPTSQQIRPFSSSPTSTNTQEEEVGQFINEIRALCKFGNAHKAEQLIKSSSDTIASLSSSEILTCYNLVLWGWSQSNDENAAERSERWLEAMSASHNSNIMKPTLASYNYALKALSRSKKTSKWAGRRAEALLRKLQSLGLKDQWESYHFVFKACAKSREGHRAIRLLEELLERGKEKSSQGEETKMSKHILATVLIGFKSDPHKAESLLENLEAKFAVRPDPVHYSIVLDAWAKAGNGPQAEKLFTKMIAKGVKPTVVTCNSLLHALMRNIERQEEIYKAMVQDFLDCPYRNPAPSALSLAESKSDNFADFAAVRPNVQGLSYVLTAQARAKVPQRSEDLLAWIMDDERIRTAIEPNIFCWASVLNGWAQLKRPQKAEELLRRLQQNGFEANTVIYTTCMQAWASVGNAERTQKLWDEMVHEHKLQPNQYTLNTLIMAYANARKPEMATAILKDLPDQWNISPDVATYASVLRAWELSKMPQNARGLLEEIRHKEVEENVELLDVVSYNTVLSAYAKCGMPEMVESLLTDMIQGNCRNIHPNAKSFGFLLLAYTRSNNPVHRKHAGIKAEEVIGKMQSLGIKADGISLNLALHCFATSGDPQKAEDILRKLILSGAAIDLVAYNTCLNAWARLGNAERTDKLFLELFSTHGYASSRPGKDGGPPFPGKNSIGPDVRSFSIVLSAWAKQGTVEAAEHTEAILEHTIALNDPRCKPDTVAYNTVLRAWLNVALASGDSEIASKCGERAEVVLAEMENQGRLPEKHFRQVRPDHISYSTVIQIWRLAKNGRRAQILIDKSRQEINAKN